MSCDLNALLLDLTGLQDEEVSGLGREHYHTSCIDSKGRGIRIAHDGQAVLFHSGRYDHAFYTSKDWRVLEDKGRIDRQRVARVRWIVETIGGNVSGSDCWLFTQNVTKRLYRIPGQNYVVWLEKYEAEYWTFSSAYTASPYELRRYVENEKRIWKYGQKNAP